MLRLSEVILVEAALYGYTQRVGSICNPTEPDEQLLRDSLAAIRHFESAVGEWGEGLAAYAPVKVAWLYSGLCTRTLVFGERGVWETYLGEPRRFLISVVSAGASITTRRAITDISSIGTVLSQTRGASRRTSLSVDLSLRVIRPWKEPLTLLETSLHPRGEVKSKTVLGGSRDFVKTLGRREVSQFLDVLDDGETFVHYSAQNNFYFAIVDIVDSALALRYQPISRGFPQRAEGRTVQCAER